MVPTDCSMYSVSASSALNFISNARICGVMWAEEDRSERIGADSNFSVMVTQRFTTLPLHMLQAVDPKIRDMLIIESHQDVPTTADGKGSMRKALLPLRRAVFELSQAYTSSILRYRAIQKPNFQVLSSLARSTRVSTNIASRTEYSIDTSRQLPVQLRASPAR